MSPNNFLFYPLPKAECIFVLAFPYDICIPRDVQVAVKKYVLNIIFSFFSENGCFRRGETHRVRRVGRTGRQGRHTHSLDKTLLRSQVPISPLPRYLTAAPDP